MIPEVLLRSRIHVVAGRQETLKTILEPENLPVELVCRAAYTTDHRVEPGTIPAACQNADFDLLHGLERLVFLDLPPRGGPLFVEAPALTRQPDSLAEPILRTEQDDDDAPGSD